MKQILDIESWPRKDHYQFFKQFDNPFFNVCVNVDCTHAYATAKKNCFSFFLYYLHCSLVAVNNIEAFRYRIVDDEVVIYDVVNASPTINRPDGTFGFAYIDYKQDFGEFIKIAQAEIDHVQNSKGLVPALSGENVVLYSSIPWINFTSLSHARNSVFKDSMPRISFGKVTEDHGRKIMPVSIAVHHALMDGYHVGQFVDQFQELMNLSS